MVQTAKYSQTINYVKSGNFVTTIVFNRIHSLLKLIELDSHPLIETFRKVSSSFVNEPHVLYHLLLPPEYSLGNLTDPLTYLFVESDSELSLLRQYNGGRYALTQEGNWLVPAEGFADETKFEILQTTPCSTTNGFSFEMHEMAVNPFIPSPIPPLCFEIQETFQNPNKAMNYLKTGIRSAELPAVLNEIETIASKTEITAENINEKLMMIHDYMDKISEIVFSVTPFHYIPTVFKMRTNYIIFYAVVNLFHAKLLNAYHEAFKNDNKEAQKAVSRKVHSIGDPKKLDMAARHLRFLHTINTIEMGIRLVTNFFDGVLSSLPDANAAADDILPAVCDGLTRCPQVSSHIVSSFQYLAEVWPTDGLDQRTTYILVTCSIAASHFASESPKEPIEKPVHQI